MKRELLISFLTLSLVIARSAFAQTGTPSATTKKIEDLKDRLATKVAELRQTSRRAIFGTVKSTSLTTFVVETQTRDVKIELTDDITVIQYLRARRTKLTTEDIAKGYAVAVFGQHDATLDLLSANVVIIHGPTPERVSGTVAGRDEREFTLTVTTPQGQTYTIDIEKTTKTSLWDREKKEIVKSGFSKIASGSAIHIVGSPVPKQERRIRAHRILDLGNLSTSPTATPTP